MCVYANPRKHLKTQFWIWVGVEECVCVCECIKPSKFSMPLSKTEEGVNFTNILCAAFMSTDPKSVKKYSQAVILFALLGSVFVKVWHKMLLNLPMVFEVLIKRKFD